MLEDLAIYIERLGDAIAQELGAIHHKVEAEGVSTKGYPVTKGDLMRIKALSDAMNWSVPANLSESLGWDLSQPSAET